MLPAYAGMILSTPKHLDTGVSLPAYAGMIHAGRVRQAPAPGAPRVCGDDPRMDVYPVSVERCSPRMRG